MQVGLIISLHAATAGHKVPVEHAIFPSLVPPAVATTFLSLSTHLTAGHPALRFPFVFLVLRLRRIDDLKIWLNFPNAP